MDRQELIKAVNVYIDAKEIVVDTASPAFYPVDQNGVKGAKVEFPNYEAALGFVQCLQGCGYHQGE